MEHFIQFLLNHWLLSGAFLLVFAAVKFEEWRGQQASGLKVSTQKAVYLLNKEQAVVLDIRPKVTFEQGHIRDSIQITVSDLPAQLQRLERHKQHPVIIACATGTEARKAGDILRRAGFATIHLLDGGIKT